MILNLLLEPIVWLKNNIQGKFKTGKQIFGKMVKEASAHLYSGLCEVKMVRFGSTLC